MEGEEGDWSGVLSEETEVPFFLDEGSVPFRTSFLAEEGVIHIQLRSNQDESGHALDDFIEQVRSEAREYGPRAIVGGAT